MSLKYSLAVVGFVATTVMILIPDLSFSSSLYTEMTTDDHHFISYVAKFGKHYATKEEFEMRGEIFKKNLNFINQNNARKDVTYTLAPNKFSDYTEAEYKKMLGYKQNSNAQAKKIKIFDQAPSNDDLDWRQYGVVTDVKD